MYLLMSQSFFFTHDCKQVIFAPNKIKIFTSHARKLDKIL